MAIFEADDFRRDWYGHLTNQISHTAIGAIAAWIGALCFFQLFGEYPVKLELFIALAAGYFAFELGAFHAVIRLVGSVFGRVWNIRGQGWQGRDTIEDWVFFVVWGAGGTMAAFSEIQVGSIWLAFDPSAPVIFAQGATVHLAIGTVMRAVAGRAYEDR